MRRPSSSSFARVGRALRRRVADYPPPKVLVNSLPKSGTHLVARCLDLLPMMMHAGKHFTFAHFVSDSEIDPGDPGAFPYVDDEIRDAWPPVDVERCRQNLGRVRDGQFATTHQPVLPGLAAEIRRAGFRALLVLRDPRDVVVSQVHYALREPGHRLNAFFSSLGSFDACLSAAIAGIGAADAGPALASIGRRMDMYGAWAVESDVLTCRFESLVGPRGGGDAGRQREAIREIALHVDRPLTEVQLDEVAARVWSTDTNTFRKGAIGEWATSFTAEHRHAFKESVGQRLIDWGYEESMDW